MFSWHSLPATDLDLAFLADCLAHFIKGHDHDSGPKPSDSPGLFDEVLRALFQ